MTVRNATRQRPIERLYADGDTVTRTGYKHTYTVLRASWEPLAMTWVYIIRGMVGVEERELRVYQQLIKGKPRVKADKQRTRNNNNARSED